MSESKPKIVQMAFVTPNLDAAIDHWRQTADVGPFFEFRNFSQDMVHRGVPSTMTVNMALAQMGEVQLEVIELIGSGPSVCHDMYPNPGQGGLHHMAMFVDDLEKEVSRLEAAGHETVVRGDVVGVKLAFVDTRSTIGAFTEIYQDNEGHLSLVYDRIRQSAKDWDGKDPVRPLASVLPWA